MTFKVWFPDSGEVIEDAEDVHNTFSHTQAAEVAVEMWCWRDAEYPAETKVRVTDGAGPDKVFLVELRSEPVYTAREITDDCT